MADDVTIGGVPFKSKDIGGKNLMAMGVLDQAGADALGLVTANPAATSILGRLKSIADYLDTVETLIGKLNSPDYEAVAAGATDAILGGAGAAGDLLAGVLIVPATLSPGVVSLEDGAAGATIVLFAGGASSVTTLHPFFVPFGAVSAAGGWRLTTGANVSAVAVGNFT